MAKRFITGAGHLTLMLACLLPCVCWSQQSLIEATLAQTSSIHANDDTPYEREFASIQLQLAHATAPEAAVLLARAEGLRDKLRDSSAFDEVVKKVAADPQQHTLVRDDARFYLAGVARRRGGFTEAEAHVMELGFIRHWAVSGPFATAGADEALLKTFGIEKGYRRGGTIQDGSRQSKWAFIPVQAGSPWTELRYVFAGKNNATVFLTTTVFSQSSQDVALRFASDLPNAVYVNGERVSLNSKTSDVAFDQYTATTQLQPGWNSVVVKLVHASEPTWRFGLRVTGLHGEKLGLKSEVRESDVSIAAPATVGERQADDLVDMASSVAALEPTAQHLETQGALEHIRRRDSGHDHLDAAARKSPTPERWLHVAEACGDATCRYQALAIALRLNSAYEPAILALSDYYSARGQKTKTRDLLQEALRRESNDFVAKDKLIELHAAAGLTTLALQESDALHAKFSSTLWLKTRLMARYEELGAPERAASVAREILKQDSTATAARNVVLRRPERDGEALPILQAEAAANSADPAPLARIAEVLVRFSDIAGAERAYGDAVARAPFDAALRQSLATVMSRRGAKEQAAQELATAARLNSDAAQTNNPGLSDETPYLVNAVALAATYKPLSGDPVESLADVRIECLQPNGGSVIHVQQVIAVNSAQAAREYAEQSVRFSPESQTLQVIHARVIKHDGREIGAEELGENAVSETGAAMYYDVRARVFRFAVEAGDVVELDYRLTPNSDANPYGDYFGDIAVFGSSIPQRLKRLVVIAPETRPMHVVQERMAPPQVFVRNGERVYEWEAKDVAPLRDEPRGPALTEIAPYVHVSTFRSWQEVGAWYARLVSPQFAMNAALKQAADRVIAGKKTELEKITAIHEYVLHETHYVALEFGIYSYKPYPVAQTFARRFGDCKDKASLIVALLRYAGIDAEMALVRTRRLGRMSEDATSIALFNHAIVHVPKYDLWLDGTAEYAGLRELPLEDQGAMALTVALDGKATLRTIPVTRAEDNYTRRVVRVQVHSDGRMDFNGSTYTRGEDAPGLRRDYEIAERQRDSVRERLAEVFPTVRVEDVQVASGADLQRDVEVSFRGTLDTFTGRNALPLQSSWLPRAFAQSLAVLTTRTQDLLLPAPWISEEELHFQLPASANMDAIPRDTSISTQFGTASLRYERRGRELIVHTSVQFTKLRISPDEYSSFRAFCQQVERAFRTEVKVRLAA